MHAFAVADVRNSVVTTVVVLRVSQCTGSPTFSFVSLLVEALKPLILKPEPHEEFGLIPFFQPGFLSADPVSANTWLLVTGSSRSWMASPQSG